MMRNVTHIYNSIHKLTKICPQTINNFSLCICVFICLDQLVFDTILLQIVHSIFFVSNKRLIFDSVCFSFEIFSPSSSFVIRGIEDSSGIHSVHIQYTEILYHQTYIYHCVCSQKVYQCYILKNLTIN